MLLKRCFYCPLLFLVASISQYQESRSRIALETLKKLSQPKGKVIRNNKVEEIAIEELVVEDLMIIDEGSLIPADGTILQSNDFTTNESILTGESLPVEKNETPGNNLVYQGTLVVAGLAICKVNAIGNSTKIGQIQKSLLEVKEEKSQLQLQISNFVKKMAAAGAVIFFII